MFKMIIADDERIVRESLVKLIDWRALNIEVIGKCKNGLEALEAATDTAADLILTDIRMPGMDGLELIQRIRQLDQKIQIIIITGYSDFEYARQSLHYGVSEYLLKPVNENELIRVIRESIGKIEDFDEEAEDVARKLIRITYEKECTQAQTLLHNYFEKISRLEPCRKGGFTLLMKIKTARQIIDNERAAKLVGRLLSETDLERLKEMIIKDLLYLLFEYQEEKITLADEVKRYVDGNLDNSALTLKYIAEKHLYMNVDYLSRTFTKQNGEKFSIYLNRQRIEAAKKLLLKYGAGSVHRVAEQVGMGKNPQYFGQIFKRYAGVTPSQFLDEG